MLYLLFACFLMLIIVLVVKAKDIKQQNVKQEISTDQAEYEFGRDLGQRLHAEEYIPALQEAIKLFGTGSISKLKTNIDLSLSVCNSSLKEIVSESNFSVEAFEVHVRVAARVTAYYAIIQVCLRHPDVDKEKIVAKLGQEFYDLLVQSIGTALSLKYVQIFVDSWKVLKWINETGTGVEEKVNRLKNSSMSLSDRG